MRLQSDWHDFGSRSRRRLRPTVVVWLLAVVAVVGLLSQRARRFDVMGIAQYESRQIASDEVGRVRMVPIRLFEKVRQGQTVVLLEDDRIRCELATASAEIARLKAEFNAARDRLNAETQNLKTSRILDKRRFATDVEDARLRVLDLTTILETDRLTLQDLRLKMEFEQTVYSKNAATDLEYQTAKIAHAALERKIRENEHALNQAKLDLTQAQRRHEEFGQAAVAVPSVETAVAPLREAITVQERRLDALAVNRAMLVLKSPLDGVVTQVIRGAGEAVRAGDPILTISAEQPTGVVVYANDVQMNDVKVGMPVELVRQSERTPIVASRVVAVRPVIEHLPVRLWRNPSIAEWGRAVLVSVPPEMKIVPGELVGVRGP